MWRARVGRRVERPLDDASFFGTALGEPPRARLSRRLKVCWLMTAVGVVQGSAFVVLLRAVAMKPGATVAPERLARLVYDPAAAAPPPLPKGSPRGSEGVLPKVPEPPPRASSKPEVAVVVAAALDGEPKQVEPEPERNLEDLFGSPTGSDRGDPSGMEGGIEDGMIGGQPGGTPNGVPNGTGAGPVSDYDAPPRIVRQTRPRYPTAAFVQKVEGTVVLEILIDPSGLVSRARVIQSIPLLDAAAHDAVREWLFQPAVKGGRPVAAIAHAPVRFRLY